MKFEISACNDPKMIELAIRTARQLAVECKTSIVLLTSECKVEGHAIHVTAAVMNDTGTMSPREAKAACERLRKLADELEQKFNG